MWVPLQVTACLVLAAHAVFQLRRLAKCRAALEQAEEEAKFASDERRSERAGRVKAERELRQLQLRLGQLQSSSAASLGSTGKPQGAAGGAASSGGGGGEQQHQQQVAASGSSGAGSAPDTTAAAAAISSLPLDLSQLAFPLRPVGVLRSCFSRRNGTPRQPLLVPAARARLTLRTGLSAEFFDGLQQYSHCWVLYIFHENTDLQRLWQGDPDSGLRAKIRVPRLDGGKMGAFATRSPHRPCPIGLSVARVLGVEGRSLLLGGADIVDGSPVLDIKPYVPFCDDVSGATAPQWVVARAEEEPLDVGQLRVSPAADAALRQCWWQLGSRSLYASYEEYRQLVAEVLSRDIRSVTQRVKVPQRAQQGGPAALSGAQQQEQQQGGTGEAEEGYWKVVLDGVEVTYDVEEGTRDVLLRSAHLAA